jgi:MYXO-CTERM domain-containing protein
VRVTRMRGDISNAALAGSDLTLQLSTDQSAMSNQYNTTQQIGEPLCPVYNDSCSVVGSEPLDQTDAAASGEGGCSAVPAAPDSPAALTGLAGLLGFVVVQARRRRRSGR